MNNLNQNNESDNKKVTINIYDQEEIHHNCTVQILSNSVTGEVSIGWWKDESYE